MPVTTSVNGKIVTLEDSERQECEVYTRIMGYYRRNIDANIGKQQEIRERKMFKISEKHYDQPPPEDIALARVIHNPLDIEVELCSMCEAKDTEICKTCMPTIQKLQ